MIQSIYKRSSIFYEWSTKKNHPLCCWKPLIEDHMYHPPFCLSILSYSPSVFCRTSLMSFSEYAQSSFAFSSLSASLETPSIRRL